MYVSVRDGRELDHAVFDNGIVEFCIIEYTTVAPDTYTNGVDVHTGANWIIRNNTFRNFRSHDAAWPALRARCGMRSSNTLTEGNTFINNQRDIAYGLDAPHGQRSYRRHHPQQLHLRELPARLATSAIGVFNSANTQVLHNTVRLDGTYPNAMEYRFAATTGVQIRNNLTDAAITARDGATGTVASNVTNAQSSWFVNAANHDLHLTTSATPAIDTASALADVPTDIDGQNRPYGARPTSASTRFKWPRE